MTESPREGAARPNLGKDWLILLVGLAVQLALLSHSIRASSAAFDEGMHIAAGYRYWECGDFGINPEHPPLVKLLAAFPVRHWPIEAFERPCGERPTKNEELLRDGYRLVNGPRGDDALRAARQAILVIPLALTLVVFLTTRLWFGPAAARLALILTIFEPNLAAHGPLVTTDAAIALAALAAVSSAWWYAERPSIPRALLLGLSLGLALASKHSGIVVPAIVGLELAYLAFVRRRAPSRPALSSLAWGWAAACVIAVTLLWATYGLRFAALPPGAREGMAMAPQTVADTGVDLLRSGVLLAARYHVLPESYLAGLLYVRDHTVRQTYFFGHDLENGVWYYFPVALAIKTTLPLLLLAAVGLAGLGLRRQGRAERVVAAFPIAVFLVAAMASGINIGIRHILPVCPFLIILAAAEAADWARRSRPWAAVVVALVVWHAGSSLASHPNEMAYANEAWGGPRQVHRYLGDSNADWGQSLYRVREYSASHDVGQCWIAWFGMRKPSGAGIPCETLPGPMFLDIAEPSLPAPVASRFQGTIFVSTTLTEHAIFPYTTFARRPPIDVIAGSVLVFRGDFDLPEVAADRRGARGWWLLNHGRIDEARTELQLACRSSQSPIVAALLKAVSPAGCSAPSD